MSDRVVRLGIGLVGPGVIGKALLQQISEHGGRLGSEYGIHLSVFGLVNSRGMVVTDKASEDPIVLLSCLVSSASPSDHHAFGAHLVAAAKAHAAVPVIVDASASQSVADNYLEWLAQGIHVVTPNKRFGSGPLGDYLKGRQLVRQGRALFFYETTVGAGLPVISTLKHLIATGDRVKRVEGIFSGTLSYLFNTFDPERMAWSSLVAQAKGAGYTEPDPR